MTGKSGRGIQMDLLERTVKVVFMFRCYASTGGSFLQKGSTTRMLVSLIPWKALYLNSENITS